MGSHRSRIGTPGILLCILVLISIIALGLSGAAAAQDDEFDIDADDIVLLADLDASGDADFSIEYRLALADQADRDAFDELADEIAENEQAYIERFEDRFGPAVTDAAEATGRDMAMLDTTITTETRFVDRQYGIVTYAFTWTAFAVVDDDELTAGDALDGLFLTEETSLLIRWPETYGLVEVSPTPDSTTDRAVLWTGPREFDLDEPRITVSSEAPPTDPDDDGISLVMIIGIGVGLLAVLTAGRWYLQRARVSTDDSDSTVDTESLLSNEEQVLNLLSERGGRMKQAEVAEELDWTAAKTSKVVSTLRDEGSVEGFRLGRENVLRLPEDGEES